MLQQQAQDEARETSPLQSVALLHTTPLQSGEVVASDTNAEIEAQAAVSSPVSAVAAPEASRQAMLIKRLRRKVSRRSFLPLMDAYWEKPGPLNADKFDLVLATLRNPAPHAWREQMLCAWLLGHASLTAHQQAQAASELGKVARNRHAPQNQRLLAHLHTTGLWTLPFAALGAAAITIQMIMTTLIHKSIGIDVSLFLYMCVVLFVALLIPIFVAIFGLTGLSIYHHSIRVCIAAMLALARLETPQAVAPLARATLYASPSVRSVAEESLRQCLPHITPEHYAQLDVDTVPALCRLLHVKKERLFANHVHTEQLVLEVLAALGKVGDGSAVRPVESIAEDGWTESVRNAALAILPVLRERQQQENDPRLLLRGSTSPQAGSDQLLRPTCTASYTLPEQLLRPGSKK